MTTDNKDRQRSRRKTKAKAVLHAIFHHWKDDAPQALERRVLEARRMALSYRYTDVEWCELDKMRDRMRANTKFQQAVKEVHHG
jgi:hypothetical protein